MRVGLGRRGPWWGLLAGIAVLGVLEVMVLHWIAAALLPTPVSLAVDMLVGVATLAFLVAFASPLWSRHRITDSTAQLRLGWIAAADVALDSVSSASRAITTAARPVDVGAGFNARTGQLSMVRAPSSPLVLIELDRPAPARVQLFKKVSASSMLVSVDDADELVHAITARRSSHGRAQSVDG